MQQQKVKHSLGSVVDLFVEPLSPVLHFNVSLQCMSTTAILQTANSVQFSTILLPLLECGPDVRVCFYLFIYLFIYYYSFYSVVQIT